MGTKPLLLLPFPSGILVPPSGLRAGDPLPGKGLADLLLPLRMTVGDSDLAIHRLAIAIVVSHRLVQRRTLSQRHRRGVAHYQQPVAAKTQRTGVEVGTQAGVETLGHALLDGLDFRRADVDVDALGLRCRDEE